MRLFARVLPSLAILVALAPLASSQRKALVAKDLVEVFYDDAMVPHVYGESDEAALAGLGFHQMREFPIGTLNMLWLHSGRMAEVAGESYLDEDRLIRLWDVPAVAQRHRAELNQAKLLPLLRAYVRGIEAGRAWWRQYGNPAESSRLDALLGDDFSVNVDPVPDYLNQSFSPFGDHDDPTVPLQMRRVVDRLFSKDMEIQVEHVLRLGVCINSFFLLRNNEYPLEALPSNGPDAPLPIVPGPLPSYGLELAPQSIKASNGWLISPGSIAGGGVMTASDSHVVLNKLHIRPYIAQVQGASYRATGLTMPGYPSLYMGYNNAISWFFTAPAGEPVARNEWAVTLNPPSGTVGDALSFDYVAANGTTYEVALQTVQETLAYYDPLTDEEHTYLDTRHYVPRHPTEPATLKFTRYPVLPQSGTPPTPGSEIRFQQSAFSSEGSPWEAMIGFGRARNATTDVDAIFDGGRIIFGNGNNLLVADNQGHFRFQFMAHIPVQGVDVPAEAYSETAVLDGSLASWRWSGYHAASEMPKIGPSNVAPLREVWINNNVTPDLIERTRFTEADLANFPAYMVSHEPIGTWRQVRAIEMLRDQPLATDLQFSQVAGVDLRNQWMHMLWPFFLDAYDLHPVGMNGQALLFRDWMEEYKSHDENDQPNPGYSFEAHAFSQVTLYAALLRSRYVAEIEALVEAGQIGPLAADFGIDPLHELFEDPGRFGNGIYTQNIEAMKTALETVAALWIEADGTSGLVNQSVLASLSGGVDADPWGDARYDTLIEPHWAGILNGTKMTRWGHVNMGSLTPHYLPPPKNDFVAGVDGRGGDKNEFLRGHFYSALDPLQLEGSPYAILQVPFYLVQSPRVRPLAGVDGSLFVPLHQPIFADPQPRGYQESVYDWGTTDKLAWHPQTQGSQTLLTVLLRPGRRAQGRFLEEIGGTEITKSDLLGDGKLSYQRRFAPSLEFAELDWTVLDTQKSGLGNAAYTFRYEPYDTATY